MRSLVFTDQNSTIKVEYVTDIIDPTSQNFTVMEVKGEDTAWEKKNLPFKKVETNVQSFVKFAKENDLKLTLVDYQKPISDIIVLQDFTNQYYNGGLGTDNL